MSKLTKIKLEHVSTSCAEIYDGYARAETDNTNLWLTIIGSMGTHSITVPPRRARQLADQLLHCADRVEGIKG